MDNNTITYTNGIEVRAAPNHWRDRPSRTKVYVSYDFADRVVGPEPTGPKCRDINCKSGVCKVQRDNHASYFCEVDHGVWRKYLRSSIAAAKALMLPALAAHFGVPEAQLKLRFSAKAGCSCGCSPGFYLDGSYSWNQSVYVAHAHDIHPWKILGALGAEANRQAKAA